MIHKMKLQGLYFDLIESGIKIYEGRLNDEKRQSIKVGDRIIFFREPELKDSFNAVVEALIYFDSFEEMAKTLPLEKLGFANEKPNEVVDIYHKFYTTEDEKQYGVVAIKIDLKK